jgi:NAD(P)-dependent dehydrogenase (short-subunit alcohol dehydrogenase family)
MTLPNRFLTTQPTVLITGANRGLGLAFAEQYAARDWNVLATCRDENAASDLRQLADRYPAIHIETLDVTRDDQVARLAARYASQPVDVLLNNAGIYGNLQNQALGTMDFAEGLRVLDVNALGALRVSQAFLPQVSASRQRKIISLGGGLGAQSIGSLFGGHYFMKMSKAAHLMAMGILQTETRDRGIVVVMISPGRVDTQLMRDSGWTGAALSPADSARLVIARIDALEPAMHGRLVTCDGQIVPW